MNEPALGVSCPVCDAHPGIPCVDDWTVSGVFKRVPIHLSREFHSIVHQSEGSPMIPNDIKHQQTTGNVLDVADLTAHEELCRELEEQHDREEASSWPEDD